MKTDASKPKNIKENNVRLILTRMYEYKEMTAQGLSDITGISKTTVNKLVTDLVGAGIILPVRKGNSTSEGGRKPEVYRFNENYKYVVSTELHDDSTYCCIMNLNCEILYNYMEEYEETYEFEEAIEKLRENIRKGFSETGLQASDIGAVTVSCSAIVDEDKGTIENITIGSWEGTFPVLESLADMFCENTPIIVNNIARFSGYAELQKQPELKKERVATLLFWEATVGGCIVRNGVYENGANHMVGEIGHIVLDHGWNYKSMGNASAQFENLVNDKAILKYAYENGMQHKKSVLYPAIKSKTLTLDDVFDAYCGDDEFAADIMDRSAYCIALVMHYIIMIYDPKYFILQGIYYKAGDKFINTLYQMIKKLVPYYSEDTLIIAHSGFKEQYKKAFNVGACLYAVELLIKRCFDTL